MASTPLADVDALLVIIWVMNIEKMASPPSQVLMLGWWPTGFRRLRWWRPTPSQMLMLGWWPPWFWRLTWWRPPPSQMFPGGQISGGQISRWPNSCLIMPPQKARQTPKANQALNRLTRVTRPIRATKKKHQPGLFQPKDLVGTLLQHTNKAKETHQTYLTHHNRQTYPRDLIDPSAPPTHYAYI